MHARKRAVALAAGALLPISAAAALVPTTPAAASPNDPNVTVVGRAQICRSNSIVHRVLIQTANGEAKDQHIAGTPGGLFGAYQLSLHKVPKGGEKANIFVFCTDLNGRESSYGKTVTISRPAVGNILVLSTLKP